MKFDDSLPESLHVALRKGCHSSISSAAWNLIYLLKPKQWKDLIKCVRDGFAGYTLTPEQTRIAGKRDAGMTKVLRDTVLKWEPYGEGHEAVALFCVFENFSDNDWRGFASFLHYSIEEEGS